VPETVEPLFEYHHAIPDQPGCIFIHRHASGEHPLLPPTGSSWIPVALISASVVMPHAARHPSR
jgi:hypothetical protein